MTNHFSPEEIWNRRRELRIWTGFGVMIPFQMIRIEVDPFGTISGQLFMWHPHDLSYMNEHEASFRKEIASYCGNWRSSHTTDICEARLRRPVSWRRIYRQLRQLGVETLPDDSLLPKPKHTIFDGAGIVVEVRHGSRYRSYGYSNPHFREEPAAQRAADIMRLISGIYYHANDNYPGVLSDD